MRIRYFKAKKGHVQKMMVINQHSMPENYPRSFWEEHIARHLSWVAVINNYVVGYALIGILDGAPTLISLAVDQNFRQFGIGSGLMQHATSDNKILTLTVRATNFAAISLYKKYKFIEKKMIQNYYCNPPDDGIDMEFSKNS